MLGLGEAGTAFAGRLDADLRIYDSAIRKPMARAAKLSWANTCQLALLESNADAVGGAGVVLSLVTAAQAVAAAAETALSIDRGALYLDMNSVAPATKQEAAGWITGAGGRFVDVAVMAPVLPAALGVPLLLSGDDALEGAAALCSFGFTNLKVLPGKVGRASAIKMIRSVVIKGIEALTAECVLAAERAGVLDEVLASLDATPPPASWAARADYNLERMLTHGIRRAAEMGEVVKTLDALAVGSAMSRATAARQQSLGGRKFPPESGLKAKIAASLDRRAQGDVGWD